MQETCAHAKTIVYLYPKNKKMQSGKHVLDDAEYVGPTWQHADYIQSRKHVLDDADYYVGPTGAWVKSKHMYVSDTWKCGSLSFIFTHPPEDKIK